MPILHAVVFQRARPLVHSPYHTQQRVIGSTHGGQQYIPRLQRPKQGTGDGVGAVDKLDAHQSGLCAEEVGVDLIQLIPPQVVVAIAGGAGKISVSHPVLLEGGQHPCGVLLRDGIDPGKFLCQLTLSLAAKGCYTVVYL